MADPTQPHPRPVPQPEPEESTSAEAGAGKPLTPEEQMERFAQDLKENDWGHQPC